MPSTFQRAALLVATLISASALAGCAAMQEKHRQHHPEPGSAGMGKGGADGKMDMKSMCDMHAKMMNANTADERSAMMDERMKNMSPDMRQRQRDMMQQHCK